MNKRVYRSGVRFDCKICGKLLRDDNQHAPMLRACCLACRGDLKLVAIGEDMQLVGDAKWYRCVRCKQLHMNRRGEMVQTQPRAGFKEFT
jgi:hypothetical protein